MIRATGIYGRNCASFEYADIITDNGYLRAELKEKFARGIGRP